MTSSFSLSRRGLLKGGVVAGMAMGLGRLPSVAAAGADHTGSERPRAAGCHDSMIGVPFERHEVVRIGIVGLGARGTQMLPKFLDVLDVTGVRVTAVCDVVTDRAESAADTVQSRDQPRPTTYTDGERDFENLVAQEDIDFVYIATPWQWHFEMVTAAMRAGKHVGVELPVATELSELWDVVDTSEEMRRHCVPMANTVYGQTELRLLRMAHGGEFGDVLHGAGGYQNDLRARLFDQPWRRWWNTYRDGMFYPMLGLAPVAACMDVNRGDRFLRLVAGSSRATGLAAYREENVPPDHPSWDETYVKGDYQIALIETAQGRVIRAEHDETSPLPLSLMGVLGGTSNQFDARGSAWWNGGQYAQRYEHWLWRLSPLIGSDMDSVLVWRLLNTMQQGLVPDIDVYDAAAWCAPIPLSAESLRFDGAPVDVPDFTRGLWQDDRAGLDSVPLVTGNPLIPGETCDSLQVPVNG